MPADQVYPNPSVGPERDRGKHLDLRGLEPRGEHEQGLLVGRVVAHTDPLAAP
jgi:hypothetical protein